VFFLYFIKIFDIIKKPVINMNDIKELIILRKKLKFDFEIIRKENIECMKNTFIKEKELNRTKRKYNSFMNKKQSLKTKKHIITITSIICLIIMILSLLASIIISSFLSNVLNMVVLKLIVNTLALGELLLSISIISNMILKYNNFKNYVNDNLNKINLKIIDIEKNLKILNNKHILLCKNLDINENKLINIDKKLYNTLFNSKTIIKKSNILVEKERNKERIRLS